LRNLKKEEEPEIQATSLQQPVRLPRKENEELPTWTRKPKK
jgi:hypothetical protein